MKTGLVLAGGGAKGSFQAEVVRLLEKQGFEWDAIAGVSTGALNGSVVAQDRTSKLREIWDETRREDVWETGILRYLRVAAGMENGLYNPRPLFRTLQDVFDPNDVVTKFRSGAVDIDTGEYVGYEIDPEESYDDREAEKARRYVLASSAIPVFVEPVWVSPERPQMVDGGVRNITPMKDVIEMSDLDRIVVVVNSILDRGVQTRANNVIDVLGSTISTLLNEIVREDVSQAVKVNDVVRRCEDVDEIDYYNIDVIEPTKPLGSTRNFSVKAAGRRRRIAKKTVAQRNRA